MTQLASLRLIHSLNPIALHPGALHEWVYRVCDINIPFSHIHRSFSMHKYSVQNRDGIILQTKTFLGKKKYISGKLM